MHLPKNILHNFLLPCIFAPGTLKVELCWLTNCGIIISVHKICELRDDTQYQNLISKEIKMADTDSVPASASAPTEAQILDALKQQASFADEYYKQLASQVKETLKEKDMAEIMTPSMIMGGGGDGGLGFGSGGGLIGGLILGSLLRNGNGGLFGGDGNGAALGGAVLRNPPEQNQANMDLMAGIGAVDKSVAVSTAAMEASQATQTLGITTQLNNITSSLASRVDGLKDVINGSTVALMQGQNAIQQNIMENRYELSKDISSDGDKTRALITAQYEATLNRQLAEANAALIELRSQANVTAATRGVEVTTTNNINQMQQQQQQQAQYGQLANLIWGLGQQIRSTNEAINVGSGTLTANPANTNTNIR